MKQTYINPIVASILFASALGIGATSYASDKNDAAELAQFISNNPEIQAVIDKVEAQTGGMVVEAEFDDEVVGNSRIAFEVTMADGSEVEFLYDTTNGTIVMARDDNRHDDDHEDEDDDHNDDNDHNDDDDHDRKGDGDDD